VMPRP